MINIPQLIANGLGLQPRQVETVISLLEDGATVPFISRYRKEATGALDEVAIRNIESLNKYYQELEKRKQYILTVIEAAGALTDELKEKIENIVDSAELEDIYLPFKPKRRTRATIAIERGLEPLARIIMAQNSEDPSREAARYINNEVPNVDEAIAGALDIIASWINESAPARSRLRNMVLKTGRLTAKIVKAKGAEAENFRNYDGFSKPLKYVSSHQYLAIRRGESLGALRVSIEVDDEEALERLGRIFIHKDGKPSCRSLVNDAIADAYKRLLRPSIDTEVAAIYKKQADDEAIKLFADNLRQLLMSPPLGRARVLGVDPGYRTGCKLVCLDEQGNLLHNDVMYPCPPRSERVTSARKITNLVEAYKIDAIALGNGTASRETEQFLRNHHYPRPIKVVVVSESGASIYSASDIARKEFPDYDVTVRGAVSIGRRLIDPLAELVKIDPKSIGVGQYQHDVDQSSLKDSLDFTVASCVNQVGVNVNTASEQLLSYISGIGPKLAENIVAYRMKNGDFADRESLKRVPRMGAAAYQQSVGFLRIPDAKSPLDNTAVHPESYSIVERMASDLGVSVIDLAGKKELVDRIDINKYVTEEVGIPTLTDILDELRRPGRDPRKEIQILEFDPNISSIEDLRPGMELNGIVGNITAFGAFVDIGVHESGLVHVSQMGDKRVNNPQDVVKLYQHVRVRVLDVDLERGRISLTMKGVKQ